jgi:hypothetical protein
MAQINADMERWHNAQRFMRIENLPMLCKGFNDMVFQQYF